MVEESISQAEQLLGLRQQVLRHQQQEQLVPEVQQILSHRLLCWVQHLRAILVCRLQPVLLIFYALHLALFVFVLCTERLRVLWWLWLLLQLLCTVLLIFSVSQLIQLPAFLLQNQRLLHFLQTPLRQLRPFC